jgi:N-acetyl-gamma-glutamyl-phosphate reductase
MIRAAVVGATGYAGAELVRILAGHPDVELTALTSRQHAGVPLSEIFPAFRGLVDTVCEAYEPDRVAARADVAFLALPHRLPMDIAPPLLGRGVKVVDLSADFRFHDRQRYEAHYQPHSAPDWLERSVYGLSEVYAEAIRAAQLVGNPGCYPTSVLLPLVPLLKANLLDTRSLIADAKSGVSGAGRSPALTSLFSEVSESFKPYKVAAHRHNPEMDEILSLVAGAPVHITFVPHLVPMSRGMLTTLYATPRGGVAPEALRRSLEDFYAQRPFVRILPDGRLPDTRSVRGTNFCDIAIRADDRAERVILVSAIDNLVKGAAGQAVQNMNLMWGLDERRGLMAIPFPL